MSSLDLLVQTISGYIFLFLIVGFIAIVIIIMLIVAIFNIDSNTKAIRMILEKNTNIDSELLEREIHRKEESWIYEDENKEPRESIWNKKIF